MDEKERQTIEETEEHALVSTEEETEISEDVPAEEEASEDASPEEPQEEKRLYFGRFTPGVWHGGVLGIALSYIMLGLLGMLDNKFSLGIRKWLEDPIIKYGMIILLCYSLGKLGGHLEKKREQAEN